MDGAWSCLKFNSDVLLEEQGEVARIAVLCGPLEVDEQD
jgi:hypothetical protein